MNVPIPSQYQSQVTTAWNAYAYAVTFGSASLRATSLSVLMVWLNNCNTVLGHPKVLRPYADPPVSPSVVMADGTLTGGPTGGLEYPEAP